MYYLSVFIHILSAVFWIGGMVFTVMVLVPVSRQEFLKKNRGMFFAVVGRKFSKLSWMLFLILIVTGITNLLTRGYNLDDLISAVFWQSSFGNTLQLKLYLFGGVLVVSGLHDFYAGPKAAELMDEQPKSRFTQKMRMLSSWLGRINLLLGLGILYYAIRLIRG